MQADASALIAGTTLLASKKCGVVLFGAKYPYVSAEAAMDLIGNVVQHFQCRV